MPKPTLMGLRWVLASAAALVAGAAWCPQAVAIVGGTDTNINQIPYQAALVVHADTNSHGQFCGGTISEDGKHIITAAHCVFDNPLSPPGEAIAPGTIDVLTGTDTLGGDQSNRTSVSAVSFDPRYDPATFSHDAALLTLGSPLTSGEPVPSIMTDQSLAAALGTSSATVSGWGDTGSGFYPTKLQSTSVPLLVDATCHGAYSGYDDALMVCAGDGAHDSCFGDSGGPLVSQGNPPSADQLIGIVSFGGPNCADPTHPGVYAQATEQTTTSFLEQANPQGAPRAVTAASVQGTPTVGQTVTCNPGSWSGGESFAYQFVSGTVARTTLGAGAQYVVQLTDVGQPISCVVKVTNDGGIAIATSPQTAPVTAPVSPAPQPAPQPTPQPQPPQLDTAAPVARVTRTRCTATRCVLTVTVSDAGFSAGIKTIQASVRSTYRSTCRRKGKKVRCTRHRTGKPSVTALSATRFRVVASRLPVGRHLFTLFAVDKAGHHQALPTRKTVTTKKPKKRHR